MDGGGDFWKENLFAVESSLLKSECRQLIVKMFNNIMIFTKKFWVNLSWKITQSKYIRNMDESGISLDSHPLKLAVWKGQKKVRYTSSVRKNQITIVACGSATGQSIPPLVIFDVKHLSPLWMRYEVEGMALVKKAGLIASCCMGGWWNISWSMLLRHAHSSSSLMGIASLWTSNNYICKRERYHHFVSPSTHNSWNSATWLQLVWIPQIHWLFMTFIRRILEVITKPNSPGYFDRHGCNQLWQRIQKARDITLLIGMQFCFFTLSCWISNFQHPPQPWLGHPPQSLPSPQLGHIPSRSVTSPTTLASFSKKQEDCCKWRYSKGYDLMDPEYLRWLEIYPPEAILGDRYCLVTAPLPSF